jgi:polyhydroxybutyrate depolymerase
MLSKRRQSSKGFFLFFSFLIIISFFVVACTEATQPNTPTSAPTITPLPTNTFTPVPTIEPGDAEHNLAVNGQDRTYLLHVPPGLASDKPLPVVFAFPGYDIEIHFEISDMQYMTGYNDIADQNGFLLVYPSGISGTWNAGACCGAAMNNNVDEDAFITAMITDIGKTATIDPKRVYAVGYSLGAMMAYRLGCEMSDTFAAVASVAGALVYSPCDPRQPVSILQVHGKKDVLVPYEGGLGGFMGGQTTFPAVEDTISMWAKLDGCTGSPQVEPQGTIGTHTVYSSCNNGSAVELYLLDGLGNNWPSQYVLPASQLIWDFFKDHPKP